MIPCFTLDADTFTLVWSQRRPPTVPLAQVPDGPPFGLVVQALRPGPPPAVEGPPPDPPLLFEQTDYTLFVQSKTGLPVAVQHRDPVLLQGLHRSDGGRVVHGTINFGTQVGHSRFVVAVGGRPAVAFEVEVFPSKLDYRADYAALRADVEEGAADLVLAYLQATTMPGRPASPGATGRLAWALLLRQVLDELERALAYVARQPRWTTRRHVVPVRADRVRRPDAALRRAVQRGVGRGAHHALAGGLLLRTHLPTGRGQYTLDTPAHRWLGACLRRISGRLAEILAQETAPAGQRRRRAREELAEMQRRLGQLQQREPFQAAEGEPPPEPPLTLLTAPGYREAYRACVLLQQGLTLRGGPLALGVKELHRLYEYWCFLTLVRLAARATGQSTPLRTLIAVDRRGLHIRLRRGHAQTVTFGLPDGRRLALTYNPRFAGAGYLVPQQPDVLVTLHRPGQPPARYVLDAKYRLDASPAYRRRYGVPGPPRDALNALHRYRDALRAGGTHAVVQAVALYPYRSTGGRWERSRLRHLLDTLGVGALPLLPGATHALEAWLQAVLEAAAP